MIYLAFAGPHDFQFLGVTGVQFRMLVCAWIGIVWMAYKLVRISQISTKRDEGIGGLTENSVLNL